MDDNLELEKAYVQQRTETFFKTLDFIKTAPAVLRKYKFKERFPTIISLLLKSNNMLWDEVETNTKNYREFGLKINFEEEVAKINKEIQATSPSDPKYKLLEGDLQYIKDNYNRITNELKRHHPVKQDYTNIEFIEFYVNNAASVQNMLEQTPEDEKIMEDDQMFPIYLARLFAYYLNYLSCNFIDGKIQMVYRG